MGFRTIAGIVFHDPSWKYHCRSYVQSVLLAEQDGVTDSWYVVRDHAIFLSTVRLHFLLFSDGIGFAQKSWACKWIRRPAHTEREHGSGQIKRLQDHGTCFAHVRPLLDVESNVLVPFQSGRRRHHQLGLLQLHGGNDLHQLLCQPDHLHRQVRIFPEGTPPCPLLQQNSPDK